MGSIVTRTNSDGSKSFRAQILIKKQGSVLYRESKTFSRLVLARAWLKSREQALETPGALEKCKEKQATLSELIERYITSFATDKTGRSKLADMRRIQRHKIAQSMVSDISATDLIAYIMERRKTVSSSTAGNDLVWINGVFKVARPAFNIAVNMDAIRDAQALCYAQHLTGKSNERTRRPTREEMTKLMAYFSSMPRAETPYTDIYLFLMFSGRRASEATRMAWKDLELRNNTIYIENIKHPRRKWGNHMRLKLTERAITIIQRQKKVAGDDRIFPFSEKTASTMFSKACRVLDIKDLHMHDLRHECTSNLFEAGYQIHEVAMFTGHRSWNMLKRYTHLHEIGVQDKWEGWEWLA